MCYIFPISPINFKCVTAIRAKIEMSVQLFFLLFLLYFSFFSDESSDEEINKSQFSEDFLFGVASSSYQIEGAVQEDGKGLNNWDVFTHIPGNILAGDNADIADDHYHRYIEDIEIMNSLGVNAYRFSISWTRILPRGRFGDVNSNGIMFYNKIINNLLLKGIEPFVTIHHHDVPQELEERYGSWLNPQIQEDFVYFAEICFRNFGDRVKYWTTINEPNLFVKFAYLKGTYPPARCSAPFGNCSHGNSEIEPLIAIHNMILSHAKATDIYRRLYQPKQGGSIGIVICAFMYEPISEKEADRDAANRALAFEVSGFLDPLIFGDYPSEMRYYLGHQLPKFSPKESNMLKDSIDFIGVNHYSTFYAKDCIESPCDEGGGHAVEGFVYTTGEKDGIPIGERTGMPRFFVVPNGMEKIVGYLKTRYNNKPMFVTENGVSIEDENTKQVGELLNDVKRVEFHKSYLASLARAIKDGADVRGYFVWSVMDNFEWIMGYSARFGLYYIDYQTLERTPKLSAKWFRNLITNNSHQRGILTSKNKNVRHTTWRGVETDMDVM